MSPVKAPQSEIVTILQHSAGGVVAVSELVKVRGTGLSSDLFSTRSLIAGISEIAPWALPFEKTPQIARSEKRQNLIWTSSRCLSGSRRREGPANTRCTCSCRCRTGYRSVPPAVHDHQGNRSNVEPSGLGCIQIRVRESFRPNTKKININGIKYKVSACNGSAPDLCEQARY